MDTRKDDSDQALSWALIALISEYGITFDWDELGRLSRSFGGAPGVDISAADNLLIGLSSTADGVGWVNGDKAGAENWDNEGSETAVVVGGDGTIKGAASQTKTTQSTISDPAARRIVPKRCVFVTISLP